MMTHAARYQPHLIVWPVTMFPVPDFELLPDVSDADLIASLPPEAGVQNAAIAEREVARWKDGHTQALLENRSAENRFSSHVRHSNVCG